LADQTLTDFVKVSLQSGATKGEIKTALIEAGWSGDQIADALATFSDVNFVVPIPKPKAQLSARDAFFYLVTFVTLYVSAFHLGSLLFDFVNLALPDELNSRTNRIYRDIRWATSALVVSFPIFLYLSYKISSEIAQDPTRRNSAVRRWLTYLTLIVGDLIYVVYNLLSGEITTRFLLKTAIVLCIAGSIFSYYLWSMKADDEAMSQ